MRPRLLPLVSLALLLAAPAEARAPRPEKPLLVIADHDGQPFSNRVLSIERDGRWTFVSSTLGIEPPPRSGQLEPSALAQLEGAIAGARWSKRRPDAARRFCGDSAAFEVTAGKHRERWSWGCGDHPDASVEALVELSTQLTLDREDAGPSGVLYQEDRFSVAADPYTLVIAKDGTIRTFAFQRYHIDPPRLCPCDCYTAVARVKPLPRLLPAELAELQAAIAKTVFKATPYPVIAERTIATRQVVRAPGTGSIAWMPWLEQVDPSVDALRALVSRLVAAAMLRTAP